MTQSATSMLTGDTGQLEAIQTVPIGVDGNACEIDLESGGTRDMYAARPNGHSACAAALIDRSA